MAAQHNLAEKLRNTLGLLSNGFNKLNSSGGGFQLMRTAASGLVVAASNSSSSHQITSSSSMSNNHSVNHHSSDVGETGSSVGPMGGGSVASAGSQVNHSNVVVASSSAAASSANQINREVRIGVTYAYVELANLLGSSWLERNLRLLITSVLALVNGTKSVATHLDAVYSRKCVQFILRSIIGGMLNEKMQLEAARILLDVVDKCTKGLDFDERPAAAGKGSG